MDYHGKHRKGAYPASRWKKTPGRKQASYYETDSTDIGLDPIAAGNIGELLESPGYQKLQVATDGVYAYILSDQEWLGT